MPKKTNHQETIVSLSKAIIALAIVLGVSFLGFAIAGCFKKQDLSRLEERELEAFESIFAAEISNSKLNENENTTASLTNIGLSENDDLYGDIVLYYYNENHEVTHTQNGKVYLQCDHQYRRPVTNDDDQHCGFAYSWEEKVPAEN